MKKILIIDILGITNHPKFEKEDLVEFRSHCKCPENLVANEYMAAFIHQRNDEEVFWAKKNLEKVFVFSGGYDHPINVRGEGKIFNLPKSIYDKYIIKFINHYAETCQIDPNIFWGK